MATFTIGTSNYGVVVAGCSLSYAPGPGSRLRFTRGLHISAVFEYVISPGVRGWQIRIDNDTSDAFFDYVPIVSMNGVATANGEAPANVVISPRAARIAGPAPLVYLVSLTVPTTGAAPGVKCGSEFIDPADPLVQGDFVSFILVQTGHDAAVSPVGPPPPPPPPA